MTRRLKLGYQSFQGASASAFVALKSVKNEAEYQNRSPTIKHDNFFWRLWACKHGFP